MFNMYKYKILSGFILVLVSVIILSSTTEAMIYNVGPGKKYEKIASVPFDRLDPGDVVKIFYRKKPYRERIILRRSGTKKKPIIIRGVSIRGKLPVIDGKFATQFQKEVWKNSGRWLIKIGDGAPGDYVRIENLVLRNANNTNTTVEAAGRRLYTDNAAGIFLRSGKSVVVSNCRIFSCGNGILTYWAPDVIGLRIRKCLIYKNGNHRDRESDQEHNVYLQGSQSIIEFCRFGKPYANGQNLKDRGMNTIIRYNWIEDGYNRQLDLVDRKEYDKADAFVYGNVIVQGKKSHNYNMIHWGGDLGHSRSGTLYLFNNTIVGKHAKTRYIDVQYSDCKVDMRNNVFIGQGKLWNYKGTFRGMNNWFSKSIAYPENKMLGKEGSNPGFYLNSALPFLPYLGSYLINNGTPKTPLPVKYMPNPIGGGWRRPIHQGIDIGAYEFSPSMIKRIFKGRLKN